MIRRFTLTGLPMACVLLLAVAAAPAAEDFLKLVPDSALGFVVLNRPAATDAKLQALARHMQLPVPGLLAMLKQRSGIQEGLDESGTIVFLVLPPEGKSAMPSAVLLVPVNDYGKFVGQLHAEDATQPVTKIMIKRSSCWVRSIGGYAALTDVPGSEIVLKKVTLRKEIPAALAPWQRWLKERDFAAVILPPGIKQISTKAQQGIQAVKFMLAARANEQAKAAAGVFDLYAKMFQAAEREVLAWGFGLQLDRQNVLRITTRTRLISSGLLGQDRPSQQNLLAGLPAGPFVMAGGGAVSASTWKAMLKWSFDIMKSAAKLYGINEEQTKKLSALSMPSMERARGFSMMLGADEPGGSIFSSAIGVMRVDHSPAFMAAYEEDIRKYAELFKGLHSPLLGPMEVKKCEVGGTAALQFTAQAPKPPAGQPTPQQAQAMERMMELYFGPGGKVVAWVVPADEQHVVLGYVSKKPLQRAMEAIRQGKPGLAGDAGVAKTAALLPSGARAVVYISPAETIKFIQRMAPAIAPPGAKWNLKLPEFPKTPPLGFAVTTAANEVQTCLVVPAEVLQAIGPYTGQIQAMRMSAAPGAAERDDKRTEYRPVEPTLVGSWHAKSLSMALPDGSRKTLAGDDAHAGVFISEKTCTIRTRNSIVASMSYVLDTKRDPWTVDMKSKEGVLLGICAKNGYDLQISLDDQAKGRPRDFDTEKHDMVLVLRRVLGMSLLVMNADGSNLHTIVTMPEYTFVGRPQWSHDGRKIAFSGWRSVMGEVVRDAHNFVVNADGGSLKDLGAGINPSWSPDDKQFTYSQFGDGVWIMNADGSNRREIDLDRGWGSQWSPTRNEIAYTTYDDRGVLCIYDVATGQSREVEHKPYAQTYHGLAWSPDGKWICFKAALPGGGNESVAVSTEREKQGFKVLLPSSALPEVDNAYATMSWGGTGKQILVRMQRKSDPLRRLYILDSTGVQPPRLFPNFSADWVPGDAAWSWDGKQVVMSANAPDDRRRPAAGTQARKSNAEAGPLTLDIARFCRPSRSLDACLGRNVIDGLPFEIRGQAGVWGRTTAQRDEEHRFPQSLAGIRIGRTFDEARFAPLRELARRGRANDRLHLLELRRRHEGCPPHSLWCARPRPAPPAIL